jgi:putative phage-type endonuclease
MVLKPETHDEWLEQRKCGIGGSDAGTVLGVNKYKSNVELWLEKTGQSEPEDISDKPAVKFGKFAEQHLRELFKQDFPDYKVDYHEFWIYQNDKYPFIYATLDGEIIAPDGSRGILEIKTTTIRNKDQWDEWEDKIPDSYYAQVLHQLVATGWDFAVLKAYIRYYKDGELRVSIRHYRIDRKDKEAEMQYLIDRESKFWACIKSKTKPALILPEI